MDEHPMPPGTRVRHYGQQWPEARREGTGNIVEAKGPWPDGSYEYLVRTGENFANSTGPDNPETRETWWASHATIAVSDGLARLFTRLRPPICWCGREIQPGENHGMCYPGME